MKYTWDKQVSHSLIRSLIFSLLTASIDLEHLDVELLLIYISIYVSRVRVVDVVTSQQNDFH